MKALVSRNLWDAKKTGEHSLMWPVQVCAAEPGGCFARSWALNRLYNFTIKRLEQGVFLDWKPFEECQDFCDEQCTFAILIIFFLNFYFTILVWKIIKFCMQNKTKQGQKVVPSLVLNIIVKWAMFVLNGVGVWRPRWHSFTQSLWSLFWS